MGRVVCTNLQIDVEFEYIEPTSRRSFMSSKGLTSLSLLPDNPNFFVTVPQILHIKDLYGLSDSLFLNANTFVKILKTHYIHGGVNSTLSKQ